MSVQILSRHQAIREVGVPGTPGMPRPRWGELWVLVGLPGAGKSTFAAAVPGARVVSIDEIRRVAGHEVGTRAWLGEAYARAYDELEAVLAQGHLCVFDSSGLYGPARREAVALARRFGRPARLLFLATDPATAAERQARDHPARTPLRSLPSLLHRLIRRVRDGDIVCEGWASVHGLDEAVQQEALARWHAGLR